jgi:hypothetical protein
MGAKFSSGPVVTDLVPLSAWSIDKVEGCFNSFRKDADNPFFVTRADYRRVFDVTKNLDKQFKHLDPARRGRVSAFLLFGAIALMADSRPEAKLRFMLSMIDLDYSRFLNRCEVVMVMRSASLGLARAKGKEPPSVKRLEGLVWKAMSAEGVSLNADGEVAIADVVAFCCEETEVLFYLISLASTRGADVAKLWRQQKELLLRLSEAEARLEVLGVDLGALKGDRVHQRLDVAAPAKPKTERQLERDRVEASAKAADAEAAGLEAEHARRHARAKARLAAQKGKKRPRMRVLPKMMSAAARRAMSAEQLRAEEIDLAVQRIYVTYQQLDLDPDGLALVDVDTLQDLAEAAEGGLSLHDEEAAAAVATLARNALGHVSVEEVERWYREVRCAPRRPTPNQWQRVAWAVKDAASGAKRAWLQGVCGGTQARSDWAKAMAAAAAASNQAGGGALALGAGNAGEEVPADLPADSGDSHCVLSLGVGDEAPTEPEQVRAALRLDAIFSHSPARKAALAEGPHAQVIIAESVLRADSGSDSGPHAEGMESVLWVDFSVVEGVVEAEASEVAASLLAFLETPAMRAELRPYFSLHKVEVVKFGEAREGSEAAQAGSLPSFLLRALFFSETDPLALLESAAGVELEGLVTKFSAHVEANRSLLDLVNAQADFVHLKDKLYQPKNGRLATFGEEVAEKLFRRFDRDGDGVLCFEEMNEMLRGMGQDSLSREEMEEVVREEAHMYKSERQIVLEEKRIERMLAAQEEGADPLGSEEDDDEEEAVPEPSAGVTLKAFQRSYGRSGGLEQDLDMVGVGGVDEQLSATITLTAEVKCAVLQQLEKLLADNCFVDRLKKQLFWIGRMVNDIYLDGHAPDWRSLWERHDVPNAFLESGWVVKSVLRLRRFLADGPRGALVELRKWAAVAADDGELLTVSQDAQAVLDAAIEEAKAKAESMAQKEEMIKAAEAVFEAKVEAAKKAREAKIAAAHKAQMASPTADGEADAAAKDPEASAAAAGACKFYDHARARLSGISAISAGNARMSLRLATEGLDFASLLPEGRGEKATEF